MAMRSGVRYVFRRFSSNGRVLSEEEKAAENVYIKKLEQEKLEKLARKGPKAEGQTAAGSGGSAAGSSSSPGAASAGKASTNKYQNYAVMAGVITVFGALGWYLNSSAKKPEKVRD